MIEAEKSSPPSLLLCPRCEMLTTTFERAANQAAIGPFSAPEPRVPFGLVRPFEQTAATVDSPRCCLRSCFDLRILYIFLCCGTWVAGWAASLSPSGAHAHPSASRGLVPGVPPGGDHPQLSLVLLFPSQHAPPIVHATGCLCSRFRLRLLCFCFFSRTACT